MPRTASSTETVEGVRQAGTIDAPALARALRETLGLRHAPVALLFVVQQPDAVDSFSGEVPSACTFWRLAEERTFFAPAEAHEHCPIGALTMGFSMAEAQRERLMDLVGKMAEIDYLQAEEAAIIPSVPGDKSGIVYGPLEMFPLEPDAVLVWVSATGAMLLAEATRGSDWTPERSGTPTFGRPSCAAIAMAVRWEAATLSVGCTGMRTFTGIDADLEMAVLPRAALADLPQRLEATARANTQMAELYRAQKDRFTINPPLRR
jgi:uncharacterized protein (DUF169 family)